MSKAYILYNPAAGTGKVRDDLDVFQIVIGEDVVYADITETGTPFCVLDKMEEDDYIILCGGDGTLSRFANDIAHLDIQNEILYYPCGKNNDFAAECYRHYGNNPFSIAEHLKELPAVTVKGITYRFLNGVGLGINLSGCQKKDVNTLWKALQQYQPAGATVCVDAVTYHYEKVWLVTAMYGKYYGGIIPAPGQKRGADALSLSVVHGSGKLKILALFCLLFGGRISKYKQIIPIHSGKEITVTFDTPRTICIDGECVPEIISYTATR